MDRDLEVTEPHDHAAGVLGVAVAMRRSLHQMGSVRAARTLLKLNQAEGFDCMSCAWPDPDARASAHGRVLRERRQGGRRGGDQGAGDPGVLRRPQHRGAGRPVRALARPAGPDHPPDDQATGRHALRADRLGRGLGADRRELNALDSAPTRRSSTPRGARPTRPPSPTSSSSAPTGPTTCPTARTCATSRPASPWPSPSASARPA